MEINAAVVFEKSGSFSIERLELSEPKGDEVLVRIVGVGICHTDLVARDQHLPIPLPGVFGHEGSGVVESVGARVTKIKPGDHVVLTWGSCGTCTSCRAGRDSCCLNFLPLNFSGARPDGTTTMRKGDQVIHGSFFGQSSFSDFALAPERNVVKVRKDVRLEILGPLGCGVQTGAGGVINALHPRPGTSIAIFGVGTVGMSAVLAASVCGCTTIMAVDINPERLEIAEELGATHSINASEVDPVEAIEEITSGGAEFTLECVGIPEIFRKAVDALSIGGVCGLIGVAPVGVEVGLEMQTILNARTIKGIVECDGIPDLFIPKIIELYCQGRFPFDRLIKLYPFDQIEQAVEDMEKGLVIKPILRP